MYFEHVTMRDGLSQSSVMSILQDSEGYVWLGTESGLNRYDGYKIREYRRERGQEDGLASDYIWRIAEDGRGDLWLATMGGGLARWDRRTDRFEQFRHDPDDPHSLASDALRTLLIDAAGRIWIGTEAHGLDVFDPKTRRARHYRHDADDPRSLAYDSVFALYEDRAGRIWIGTDRGLNYYEPDTDDFQGYGLGAAGFGFGELQVRSILEDHTGHLWIGTLDSGVHRLDPQTGRVVSYRHDPRDERSLSADRVLALLEDDAHRLWVATTNGLNLFDHDAQRFVRYGRDADDPHSLRDNDIMSLYQDRGGVLWVGTRRGGASHWNPNSWALGHYTSPLIRGAAVNTFTDDGDGHVWVGTSNGLIEIDARTGTERRYGHDSPGPLRLPDDRVMALLHDSRGALWIGTMTGGLERWSHRRERVRAYRHTPQDPASLPADGIMTLYEDRNGHVWVGTFGGGLARIDPADGRVMRYPYGRSDDSGLSSPRASAIAEDTRGNLWIGTIGGGLNLLDRRTNRFHRYRRNDRDPLSLSDDTVYAVHVDRHGDVWIGTAGGGLERVVGSSLDPEAVRFESESRLSDLPSQVVYGIESDVHGRLWLSTNKGLVRFDPRDGATRLFGEAHGLQDEEFNFNAHYRGRDGTLYFGGNNGFNAFQPEEVNPDAPPPRVALTSVSILNEALPLHELPRNGRALELGYGEKLVTFEFAALDFIAPTHNRYQYRLEGFDSAWVDAGGLPRATYTNLDAGRYTFRVRAANADGVWSTTDLAVPVHVAPPPWSTPAARSAYSVAALLVLVWLWQLLRARRRLALRRSRELEEMVRMRTHELEERNQQLLVLSRAKSDFVARMNHELRTPMNGVLGLSELLLDTRLEPVQRRFVEGIRRSADSLLAIVDDVLDFSKIEAGRLQLVLADCDLVELVEQTAEMLATRASAKGIELICDCPAEPLCPVRIDAVRLRQVLVNLGGNAVKFTDRGEVTFRLVPLGRSTQGEGREMLRVRFEVVDTGIGIEPEAQARIFEEFVQGDASTTRRFGGTGLGLAIARQLVELMGGQLALASERDAGSTFSFELLLECAARSGAPPSLPGVAGMRVLVAVENAALRGYIVRTLDAWRARAIGVAAMDEALRELRATPYNVLVIDDSGFADAGALLAPALEERATRPRVLRLVSLAMLARTGLIDAPWFDAELTKPLRLAHLRNALMGQAVDADERPATASAPSAGGRPLLRGRVLVVEDQAINREVACAMLAGIGVEVDVAVDGRQALEMLAERCYDLVLMDCQMPEMDGFSATRALREREGSSERVPVIALTADTTSVAREACYEAGMDDYLGKPFSRATLHAKLARWLPAQQAGEARDARYG